jgi:hypothetical protein
VTLPRCLAALAFCLLPFVPALADEASRAAKMVELVSNVNLPYIQRTFSILIEEMRRELPRKFADKIGTDGALGPKWRAGNPFFDRAEARLTARFADSERAGRLAPPSRSEIARILRTSWTEEEIDFLVRYVKTDAGKQVLEFIDALTLPALRTALAKNAQVPAQFESRTADIALEATQRVGALTPTLGKLLENSKEETGRAMALAKAIDHKSSESVGQLWAGRLVTEIITIAGQERFEMRLIMDDFRRSEGLPAPPATPAPSRL